MAGVCCVVSNRTSESVAGTRQDGGGGLSESMAGDRDKVPYMCVLGVTGMDVMCDGVVCIVIASGESPGVSCDVGEKLQDDIYTFMPAPQVLIEVHCLL